MIIETKMIFFQRYQSCWSHLDTKGRFKPVLLSSLEIWVPRVVLLRVLGLVSTVPKIKYFFSELEKLLRLGLLVMREGSSFHNVGPAKSMKRLRDSSLEIVIVTLVLSLLRKLLAKLSGRNPFFSLHINLAFFNSIVLSRGSISSSLKRGSVWWSLFLNEIMRTAFFYLEIHSIQISGGSHPPV